jgi:hypothetical protein
LIWISWAHGIKGKGFGIKTVGGFVWFGMYCPLQEVNLDFSLLYCSKKKFDKLKRVIFLKFI